MVSGDLVPTAEMIVAVGELDRGGSVQSSGVDVRSKFQELSNERGVSGHDGPMNGLVAIKVPRFKELGGLKQS